MTPLLKNTGWGGWSGETKGTFLFYGGYGIWSPRSDGDGGGTRSFPVRSRDDG